MSGWVDCIAVDCTEEHNMWQRIKKALYEGINQQCCFCKNSHADTAQLISETASNDAQLF